MTFLLSFLKLAWKPLAIIAVLGGVYLYAYHKGSASQSSHIAALQDELAVRERAAVALDAANKATVAKLDSQAAQSIAAIQAARYSADAAADRRVADTIGRMRAADAARVRPLAPASAAPATCQQYEAAPGLLPERDRELLVRLGNVADRVVRERNACIAGWAAADRIFRSAVDEMSAASKAEVF